jgi:hypothetical protein
MGEGTGAAHDDLDEPATGPASGGFDLLPGSVDEESRRRTGPWSGRFRAVVTGRRAEGPDDDRGGTRADGSGPGDPGPDDPGASRPAGEAVEDATPTTPGRRADEFPPRYDPRAPGTGLRAGDRRATWSSARPRRRTPR